MFENVWRKQPPTELVRQGDADKNTSSISARPHSKMHKGNVCKTFPKSFPSLAPTCFIRPPFCLNCCFNVKKAGAQPAAIQPQIGYKPCIRLSCSLPDKCSDSGWHGGISMGTAHISLPVSCLLLRWCSKHVWQEDVWKEITYIFLGLSKPLLCRCCFLSATQHSHTEKVLFLPRISPWPWRYHHKQSMASPF